MIRTTSVTVLLLILALPSLANPPAGSVNSSPGAADAQVEAAADRSKTTDVPAKRADVGDEGDKVLSGMSIVGNDEAPKSLVIVPWKGSELGNTLDVSRAQDDARDPVDRDVFMRELTYYEIRVGK
jgi:hypothetical protein